MRKRKGFTDIVDRVGGIFGAISASLMFFMMCVFFAGVVSRALFDKEIVWSFELAGLMLLPCTFLALGYTLLKGGHVRVDLLVSHLSRKKQLILEIICLLLCLILMAFLLWGSSERLWEAVTKGFRSYTRFAFPLVPFYIGWVMGVVFLGFQIVAELIKRIAFLRRAM